MFPSSTSWSCKWVTISCNIFSNLVYSYKSCFIFSK
uniref:Uncharacterized protein n=1 Tax=Siphoviridae sp. ctiOl67 TaxID=2825622 RepID=A0A8S5QJF8_9CAUD|nr:MAG TPA: hypothetical protein [Siphoviridae sp. ctiOl67]